MTLTVGDLRCVIREAFKEDIIDDPAFKKTSVIVPSDIKKPVKKWVKKMKLSREGEKH